MASTTVSITKLNTHNWETRSDAIKSVLRWHNALKPIETDQKPDDVQPAKWEESQHKAFDLIKTNMSDELLPKFRHHTDPRKLYEALQSTFEGSGTLRIVNIIDRMFEVRYESRDLSDLATNVVQSSRSSNQRSRAIKTFSGYHTASDHFRLVTPHLDTP